MMPGLEDPHGIPAEAIASVRDNGHCVLRGLASPGEVEAFRPAIEAAVQRHAEKQAPLAERGTYGKAFLQVTNIWMTDDAVKRFVFAPRFAKAAADLLGVAGVRLYHDQALSKEPGGGHTPWHQDQNYWPLETDNTITMWMPLVDVPENVGSMTFIDGVHKRGEIGQWFIGDESEDRFAEIVAREKLPTTTYGAMRSGDATFHKGWTPHRAPANSTALLRSVMTIIYFADGTRVGPIDSKMRRFDQKIWLDSLPTGELAAGPLNPRLWPPA
jgi:ectoine hydroxylase-related dioxygenase (phytanoyl-CoA dioxygenase family)